MDSNYKKAMTKSYSNQENEYFLPDQYLHDVVKIDLGFQPAGIVSDESRSRIAVCAYFEPAIMLADLVRDDKGLNFKVSWVRGVDYQKKSIRLFPDIQKDCGANRAQTVNFGPNGELWVARSAGRKIFILAPPKEGERWRFDGATSIPSADRNSVFIHSAKLYILANLLTTIESDADLNHWVINNYSVKDRRLEFIERVCETHPHTHGLEIGINSYLSVTDYLSPVKHGILLNDRMAISGIYGSGLCFIGSGDIIVSKYGQNEPGPFNGEPGQLIYVPSKLLII